MISALLLILELTRLSKTKRGEKIKRKLVANNLEKIVRRLDAKNINIEDYRIKLFKAFEQKMAKELVEMDDFGIHVAEIESTFMNLMLKRYCLNSTFNLGLLSILGNSWAGVQPAPSDVINPYIRSFDCIRNRRRVEILSSLIFCVNERLMMSLIIIDFLKIVKRCIFVEKQDSITKSAIMIPDLTDGHFNRNEKNSLISRVIEYYGKPVNRTIVSLNRHSAREKEIIGLKEPYNVEMIGKRRLHALRITLLYAYKYLKYMVVGNTIEIAVLKDFYKYEICKISPLGIKEIIFTQSSKWSHELWPIAYNKERVLIAYGGSFWGFKTKHFGYMDEYCYYRFQKWDTLLHWNPALGEFEKRKIKKKPRIYNIGPITPQGRVTDDYERGTVQQGKYILLFDSLPYTVYGRICSNLGERYRTLDVCTRFLNDIIEESETAGLNIVIKPKRDIEMQAPYYTFESYLYAIKKYRDENRIQVANRNVKISSLIRESVMVISAPFTSTSLYSNLVYNKPAYFYDPLKQLYKDDRGTIELDLISGRDELKQLFSSLK